MRPCSSYELLERLMSVGVITIKSLVIRQTGSVERLFDSLTELKKKGFIEVVGDVEAVEKFIETARKMERTQTDVGDLQEELYQILKGQPEVANASVRVTGRGLSKAT